ncbi:MAG: hypothetical protein NT150_02255 [Bacteroidetes bacterium]|nr:hypothetical protein [Bacteroidota bacterium]
MKKIITSILSLAAVITIASSCQKKAVAYDDLPTVSTDVDTTLKNSITVNQQYQQVFTVVHTEVSNVEEQSFKTGGDYDHNPNCIRTNDKIDSTFIDGKWVKYVSQMTLTFPEQFKNTKYKEHTFNGKIVVTKTGRLDMKGTVCTVTINNYHFGPYLNDEFLEIDGKSIAGTLTLKNEGFVNGVYNMKLDLTGGYCVWMNSVSLHYTLAASVSNKIYKVLVTGSQSFGYGGLSYNVTSEITSPLLFSSDCDYIKQGSTKVTTSDWATSQITTTDYGDGTCDNKSTVVIGKETYKFPLVIL